MPGHTFGTALIDDAPRVAHDDVLESDAKAYEELRDGDSRGSRPVEDDFRLLDLATGEFQRVEEACPSDDRGAVLVVMEHRDVEPLLEGVFDQKAFRRLDVFEVDATDGGFE